MYRHSEKYSVKQQYLLQTSSAKLCGVEQRAPPIFDRAAITLGTGAHSSFFFFSSPNLSGRRLDVYNTSTHGVALVRIQNSCLKCAARGSLKMQDAKSRHFGIIAQICRAVSSQLRHISTIGKNLLNIDTSSTCRHNMVNFSLLTAEICWRVWGTPTNFNGFRVLAALLCGTLVVGVTKLCGVEQTAPPIFGRATITLGISPHSSYIMCYSLSVLELAVWDYFVP